MFPVPQLFAHPDRAAEAFRSVIAAIRSRHTERAYLAAAADFSAWCGARALSRPDAVNSEAAKGYVEACSAKHSPSTVRQRIVCLRKLLKACSDAGIANPGSFDGLSVSRKTKWHAEAALSDAVLSRMFAATSGPGLINLRDRALLALLFSLFVPVRTLRRLAVGTFVLNRKGAWLVIEPGAYGLTLPCPERLAGYLESYIHAAGIGMEPDQYLFRSIAGASGRVTQRPLTQPDVYRIIQRCARQAGIADPIAPRQVRAAGLVRFLRDGRPLDLAQELAGHGSLRTTITYAAPGTRRPRRRIAYRLADLDDDWEKDLDLDLAEWDWDDGEE